MRLWSIHPRYLDARGLVALWREGLLAQKVLLGETRGYRHHPQLIRFRATANPVGAIASYLRQVADEAERRSYSFDRSKIARRSFRGRIPATTGQAEYEFRRLLRKLRSRDPERFRQCRDVKTIQLHPMFRRVKGGVEPWEIVSGGRPGARGGE
jgi:hypothetical protein